jgi:hypothetical protein
LEGFVRRIVASDMDELAAEVERLGRVVVALERMVGLPGEPASRQQRRALVAELRSRGDSTRAIAQRVHTDRSTVMKDCRRLGIEAAPVMVGLDGRAVSGRRTPAAGGHAVG